MCCSITMSVKNPALVAGSQSASCRETELWLAAGCCMTGAMCRQPSEPREACFIRWFVLHPISPPWSKSVSSEWTMTRRNLCLAQLYNSGFKPNFVATQDICHLLTTPKEIDPCCPQFSVYISWRLYGGMERKYRECVDTATTPVNVINAHGFAAVMNNNWATVFF